MNFFFPNSDNLATASGDEPVFEKLASVSIAPPSPSPEVKKEKDVVVESAEEECDADNVNFELVTGFVKVQRWRLRNQKSVLDWITTSQKGIRDYFKMLHFLSQLSITLKPVQFRMVLLNQRQASKAIFVVTWSLTTFWENIFRRSMSLWQAPIFDSEASWWNWKIYKRTSIHRYLLSSSDNMIEAVPLLMLSECLEQCRQNSSCRSINYETGLCVLFTTHADELPGMEMIVPGVHLQWTCENISRTIDQLLADGNRFSAERLNVYPVILSISRTACVLSSFSHHREYRFAIDRIKSSLSNKKALLHFLCQSSSIPLRKDRSAYEYWISISDNCFGRNFSMTSTTLKMTVLDWVSWKCWEFFGPHITKFFKSQAIFLLFKPTQVHLVLVFLLPIRTNLVAHFVQIVRDFELILTKL